MTDALMLVAMAVVLYRCIYVVPKLSRKTWSGHQAHFAALAATYGLLAGGSVLTAFHHPLGNIMLLVAVAGWVLFDRRSPR